MSDFPTTYDEFMELAEHLTEGLEHILDDEDRARVDDVVNDIAVMLGERPDAWDGAANIGLMVAESLIGPEGPWAQPEVAMRANVVVTCFIITRLFAHPMMAPILEGWARDDHR